MGKALVAVHSNPGAAYPDNTTRVVGMYPTISNATQPHAWRAIGSGTIRNLSVSVSANTTLVTTTITVRKNGSNQSLSLTFGSGHTGWNSDLSNSFTVADGDDIDVTIAVPNDTSGSKTITIHSISFEFESDSDTVTRVGASSPIYSIASASTTHYITGGTIVNATTERPVRSLSDYTSSDLYAYVSSNGRSTTTTIKSRVNGADGNQSVTYGSGETGVKTDTANTDALTSGDDYGWALTTGTGSGTFVPWAVGSAFTSPNSYELLNAAPAGMAFSASTTRYLAPVAPTSNSVTSEGLGRAPQPFDATYTNLRTSVTANSATASSTIAFRVAGADSALLVTYGSGETGLKTDTDTVSVSATDLIGHRVSVGSGGSLTLVYAAVQGYTTTSGLTIDLDDTLTVTDDIGKVISVSKTDTATITDALAKGVSITKADVASMADALSKGLGISEADGMSIADALVKAIGVSPTDTVTPSDALVKFVGKPLADDISTSDDIAKQAGIVQSDNMSLADALAKGIGVSPADTVTASDAIVKSIGKPIADEASIVDALSKQAGVVQSDTMSLADALAKGIGVSPADTIAASDAVVKSIGVQQADIISAADALAKGLSRPLSDTIALTDEISKGIGVTQSDGVVIGDSIAKAIGITKSETVTLADLLTYVLTLPPTAQATLSCVIDNIYSMVCRDEETASGGLDPRETDIHAPGFYRHTRSKLEHLTGSAIDRKVQIYLNTVSANFKNQLSRTGVQRKVPLVLRIGYFIGDHMTDSMSVMSVDDYDIQRLISRSENWTCGNVVLTPTSSAPVRVDSTRYIWEIQVEVQL